MIIPIVRYLSAGILSYSIGIDVLAGHKLNKMKKLDVNIASGNQFRYSKYIDTISRSGIVENIENRNEWNKLCNKENSWNGAPGIIPGEYSFVYRNYVNFEEKWAMASSLSPLHNFIFTTKKPTQLKVLNNNSVQLLDQFRMFRMSIDVIWYGKYDNNNIYWESSELRSRFFYRKNPSVSEKQRQYSWSLTSHDTFIIFSRKKDKNNEKLVFLEDWKLDLVNLKSTSKDKLEQNIENYKKYLDYLEKKERNLNKKMITKILD